MTAPNRSSGNEQLLDAGTQTDEAAAVDETRPRTGNPSKPATPRPASAAAAAASAANVAANVNQNNSIASSQPRPKTAGSVVMASSRPSTTAGNKLLPARPKTSCQLPLRQQQQQQQQQATDKTPMVWSYNPDPRLRNWQRLEHLRLHSLGLSSQLSRRYNVARAMDFQPVGRRLPDAGCSPAELLARMQPPPLLYSEDARKKNDVAPFRTFQRSTCGVFFTRTTDNKKLKHDLVPTDLIKWRYFL